MEAISPGDGLAEPVGDPIGDSSMADPSTGSPMMIVRRRGSAGELHGLSVEQMSTDDGRTLPCPSIWVLEVDAPAIVVGSGGGLDLLDLEACRREGLAVVRRGSGGGPVLLEPGAASWIDVVIPSGDHRFVADVTESMSSLGQRWAEALAAVEPRLSGRLAVHRGRLVHSEWSRHSCFAGLGPGEVLLDGLKLVGMSQRRSRHGARFQCLIHHRVDVDRLRRVLRSAPPGDPPAVAVVDSQRASPAGGTGFSLAVAERLAAVLDRGPTAR